MSTVPKSRISRSRGGHRRSHRRIRLGLPLSLCSACGASVMPHRLCRSCGSYKGRLQVEAPNEST